MTDILTREQRQMLADRVDVLQRVKALLLIPHLAMATTAQVAEFFDVPTETIRSTYQRNSKELDANGAVVLSPKDLNFRKLQNATSVPDGKGMQLFCVEDTYFRVNNRGVRFYPPRAILNMAMLLSESDVAAEVRTQLLNLVEAADPATRIANIEQQEEVMKRFAMALINNDNTGAVAAISDLMALQNHTIQAQAADIKRLNEKNNDLVAEKKMLAAENTSLTAEKKTLTAEKNALVATNRLLAEHHLTWEPRKVANAIVREIARVVYNKKYSLAWYEFYRELQYQTGITVGRRNASTKDESALSTIKEEEWPLVLRTLASISLHYSIDVVSCTNEETVKAWKLDQIETDKGVIYNKGIVKTRKLAQMPPLPSRSVATA